MECSLKTKELGKDPIKFSFLCDGCGGTKGDTGESWEWKWISKITSCFGDGSFRVFCPACIAKGLGG